MPIPEFIATLRRSIGHDLLLLNGVTAVVRNAKGEVLLGLRADTHQWSLVSGILEPGEQPAEALVREVREEAGVEARIIGLAHVWTQPEVTYPNGDRAQYVDLTFLAEHVAGDPVVGDDESLEVGWFSVDALPEPLSRNTPRKIERALAFTGRTTFEGDGYAAVPEADTAASARTVLATLDHQGREVVVRRATDADLPAIVRLLADDELGATREDEGDLAAYRRGLAAIDADPHQLLVVLDDDGEVVGTLQLTLIPGISHQGAWRAQVEAVRVAADRRGSGLGAQMVQWAVEESRGRGARVVQLTSNAVRADARRFYERLGFIPSHTGFKLPLTD